MLEDVGTPGSDDWFLMELAIQYGNDLPRLVKLKSYSDGTNVLPDEVDPGMKDAYRRFIHMSRLNLADLVVASKVSRLRPLGFTTAAPGDTDGDAAAWSTWKRSGMKVGVRDFFKDAGIYGSAYLTTTGPAVPSSTAEPLIVASNGFSTATIQNSVQNWLSDAMLQVGYDLINQVEILTLFRAGYMRQAMREAKKSSVVLNGKRWTPGRNWDWVSDPIPLGYTDGVPGCKMSGPDDMGMFEKHLDSLDRITNGIRDRLTINAMQAFKQRAIKGDLPDVYPPGHQLAGQKVPYNEIFEVGPAALWRLPPGVEIWESSVTDTQGILNGSKDDVKNFSAVSSTPMYILSPDAVNASAGAADKSAEAFETSVEEWQDRAEMPIALALSLSFLAQGDATRAAIGEIGIDWSPVSRSSINEKSQAASAAKTGGSSQAFINKSIWGMSPEQLKQERQDRTDEQFEAPIAS